MAEQQEQTQQDVTVGGELSQYERERNARVAKNRLFLDSLTVDIVARREAHALEVENARPTGKKSAKKKRSSTNVLSPPSRVSKRCKGEASALDFPQEGSGKVLFDNEEQGPVNAGPETEEEKAYWLDLQQRPQLHHSYEKTRPDAWEGGTVPAITRGHGFGSFFGRLRSEEISQVSKSKIYFKKYASSCHWCRQHTVDKKAACSGCAGTRDMRGHSCGLYCGTCLHNRHGEDILKVLQDAEWLCPRCTDDCNCSVCLPLYKKRKCTGQVAATAAAAGLTINQWLATGRGGGSSGIKGGGGRHGAIRFGDPAMVGDAVKQRAYTASLTIESWLERYHTERGTLAGRLGRGGETAGGGSTTEPTVAEMVVEPSTPSEDASDGEGSMPAVAACNGGVGERGGGVVAVGVAVTEKERPTAAIEASGPVEAATTAASADREGCSGGSGEDKAAGSEAADGSDKPAAAFAVAPTAVAAAITGRSCSWGKMADGGTVENGNQTVSPAPAM